ncbi:MULTISPECIES: pilus assembly PilX family protein [Xanthomonas translucens group]|uniref:PilX protein n=3 Tax=Xanthomonas campestris pv. translucens TaxID=343 RepID=A0A109HNN3_XANCT|nr:PilX N-terminal domain-containing pilus assembly protein [Xanthomonas translucens]KTF37796.1 PilX protein [Xanthomonas translucens pv. translucens]KWV10778.1 PilX protein [Xanthomonas translucens]KWV15295.1 PilX protein [Xanthomonas translucens]MCC8445669.1 PilX protein [Xanthomonas translucens pv. translucens]MCS3359339.1 PilX N-terminal domain-containing pilus assembly protein [Xanthomonas translucens pv. translucens]
MHSSIRRQSGISLIIVLLLLLVMTLLGLAVLRSTLLEERMSSNMRDRSLAFQAAEGALRDAEKVIQGAASGNPVGFNCSSGTTVCPAIPSNTYTGNVSGCTLGAEECWVDAKITKALQPGPPQYYIQYLGQRTSEDQLGLGSSVNQNQYGGTGGTSLEHYYRIIARSTSPAAADGRAIVVLQTNVTVK